MNYCSCRAGSQVCLYHLRISPNFLSGSLGYELALVHHRYGFTKVHDDLHVVLNQNNTKIELFLELQNRFYQLVFLVVRQTGHRFVE